MFGIVREQCSVCVYFLSCLILELTLAIQIPIAILSFLFFRHRSYCSLCDAGTHLSLELGGGAEGFPD